MPVALPSYRVRFLHLTAAWAYAVSQPVFSMLDANPVFLVVRGSTRLELLVLALVLVFGAPLLAVVSEVVLGLISRRAADVAHVLLLGLFLLPFGMLVVNAVDPPPTLAVLLPFVLAAGVVAAYVRFRHVRAFLTLSMVLPALALIVFLATTPTVVDDAEGADVRVSRPVPVVVVVFDEFPLSSLLATNGEIDAVRYPNFARLASRGTWYSGATAVHDFTDQAVPSILTGRLPDDGLLPTVGDHPDNLFTLLGESYRLEAQEPVSYLCPKRYCPRHRDRLARRMRELATDVEIAYLHKVLPPSLAANLPDVSDRWSGFARERLVVARNDDEVLGVERGRSQEIRQQFDDFLSRFSGPSRPAEGRQPALHFIHISLPHSPWRFLPSGQEFTPVRTSDGEVGGVWADDPWLVNQAYQRHLLQIGYTDRLVGRLQRTLVRSGIYDDALVVLAADHGSSFVPGSSRRTISDKTFPDIARVPLFVKYPHQRQGRRDPRAARTTDILPTIADVLGVQLPWKVDGSSLLAPPVPREDVVVGGRGGPVSSASVSEVERRLRQAVLRKSETFGEGRRSLYRIGTHQGLLGSKAPLPRSPGQTRIGLEDELLFENVDTTSWFTPALISGSVREGAIAPGLELAVAVNGRIRALTRCFSVRGVQRFRALVPPQSFQDGFNRVDVFLVRPRGARIELVPLGSNALPSDER